MELPKSPSLKFQLYNKEKCYVINEDVLGFDIPVNNPSAMQMLKGYQDLAEQLLTFSCFVSVL